MNVTVRRLTNEPERPLRITIDLDSPAEESAMAGLCNFAPIDDAFDAMRVSDTFRLYSILQAIREAGENPETEVTRFQQALLDTPWLAYHIRTTHIRTTNRRTTI